MRSTLLVIAVISFSLYSCEQHTQLGIEHARQELNQALTDTTQELIPIDTLIKDKKSAVVVAETLLFEIYGKENIESQRPYEVYFIDGYWILNGTLPEQMEGGTFLIILNGVNGEVIKLSHGK